MKTFIKILRLVTLAMFFTLPVCATTAEPEGPSTNWCEEFDLWTKSQVSLVQPSADRARDWEEYERSQSGVLSRLSRSIDVPYAGKATIVISALVACEYFLRRVSPELSMISPVSSGGKAEQSHIRLLGTHIGQYCKMGFGVGLGGLAYSNVSQFASRIYRGISNLFRQDGGRCAEIAYKVMYHFREFQAITEVLKSGLCNKIDIASIKRDLLREHNYLIGELEHLIGSILALHLSKDETHAAWLCDTNNGIWSALHNFTNCLEADLSASSDDAESFGLTPETLGGIVSVLAEVTRLDKRLRLSLFNQLQGGQV